MVEMKVGNQEMASQPNREQFEAILEQLQPFVEIDQLSKPQWQQFVAQRLEQLSVRTPAQAISLMENPVFSGFIGPRIDIRRNFTVDPFRVDDPEIYQVLIDTIREFHASSGWKDRPLRQMTIPAVQYAIANYFGNAVGNQETERLNQSFYLDHQKAQSQFVSLEELRGKSIAVCAEKAAVAQNLLEFLGVDSILISSAKCHILSMEKPEAHAYNIFQTDRGTFIYDPANPVKYYLADDQLESVSPAIFPITEDQLNQITFGEAVTVKHTDYTQDDEGVFQIEESVRVYAGP